MKQSQLFSDTDNSFKKKSVVKKEEFVDIEDSVFAKVTKEKQVKTEVKIKLKEVDIDSIFNKYKNQYITSFKYFKEIRPILELDSYDVCLANFEKNMNTKKSEHDDVVLMLADMIRCVASTQIEVLYAYLNMNTDIIYFIKEFYPKSSPELIFEIIDESYAMVFKELGDMNDSDN